MAAEFLETLLEEIKANEDFGLLRVQIKDKIFDKISSLDEEFDLFDFFEFFYSQEQILQKEYSQTFSLIKIAICETIVILIKNQNLEVFKASDFISIFQLYICKTLVEESKEINFDNLQNVFLYLGLVIDLFRKVKGFCPEIFHTFHKIVVFVSQNYAKIEEIYIKWLTILMNSMFILLANDMNLDILVKNSLYFLEEICKHIKNSQMKNELEVCLERFSSACCETEMKNHLNIVKDKPIIKIKQLTPRLIATKPIKIHDKDEKNSKLRVKKLKKQMKTQSKKIKKQLEIENVAIEKEKKNYDDHFVNEFSKKLKYFFIFLLFRIRRKKRITRDF